MYKALVFTRGEVRVVQIQFELNIPYAVMDDGSRLPLDARWLRHVEQDQVAYWYRMEVLSP